MDRAGITKRNIRAGLQAPGPTVRALTQGGVGKRRARRHGTGVGMNAFEVTITGGGGISGSHDITRWAQWRAPPTFFNGLPARFHAAPSVA